MAWFAELAGKAEDLLNNIDEQTGAALRVVSNKQDPTKQKTKDINGRKKNNTAKTSAHSNHSVGTKELAKTKAYIKNVFSPPIPQTRRLTDKTNLKTRSPNVSPPRFPSVETGLPARGDCHQRRRNTIPAESRIQESLMYKQQTLEVENAMLKNELNVLNNEVSEFLTRLRHTDDELKKAQTELKIVETSNEKFIQENASLKSKLDHYTEKSSQPLADLEQLKTVCETLQNELDDVAASKELEIKKLERAKESTEAAAQRLERELRHAQSACQELQADRTRARAETASLRAEWDSYRLRVKNMLSSKDAEIRSLHNGADSCAVEDLRLQIDELNRERASLSAAATRMRSEHESTLALVQQLQSRAAVAERMASALRDALKEEKSGRHRYEAECRKLNKELSSLRQESASTISSLRAAVAAAESAPPPTASALNAADCERASCERASCERASCERADRERVERLTRQLVARQGRLDALLADNNTLRIQLDKLEEKYRRESKTKHQSVVPLHEADESPKLRARRPVRLLDWFFVNMLKRNPIVRLFMLVYIICLHLWVFTVIFNNTPSDGVTQMRT